MCPPNYKIRGNSFDYKLRSWCLNAQPANNIPSWSFLASYSCSIQKMIRRNSHKRHCVSLLDWLENKKAESTKGSSFGNSAVFSQTRRFPPPSHGGFGLLRSASIPIVYQLIQLSSKTWSFFMFERIKNYRFARVMWHDGGQSKKRDYSLLYSSPRLN